MKERKRFYDLSVANVALFVILCTQFVLLLCNQKQISDVVYNLLMQA
jgi:hypothetical protein